MSIKGKSRSLNLCLSDIPKDRMFKSVKTGKIYVNLSSYDYDQRNEHGQDFSISLPLTEEQKKAEGKRCTGEADFCR